MKLLNKEELNTLKKNGLTPVNLRKLNQTFLDQGWITEKENKKLLKIFQQANYDHHNKADFTTNFESMFSLPEEQLFTGETKPTVQSYPTHMGGHRCVVEIKDNLHLLIENVEMGIAFMVFPEQVRAEHIHALFEGIDTIILGLKEPKLAFMKINYYNLNSELPDKTGKKAVKQKI